MSAPVGNARYSAEKLWLGSAIGRVAQLYAVIPVPRTLK